MFWKAAIRQRLLLFLCASLLISGFLNACGGGSSSDGTETAGSGGASVETAQTASVQFLETGATLVVQGLLQQLQLQQDNALPALDLRPAALSTACPEGDPDTEHCDGGSVTLGFESCSLNEIGGTPFFLSKLTGQFLGCGRGGLRLSGELSADAELEFEDGCDLNGPLSSCRPSLVKLGKLAGSLTVTDENGTTWDVLVLDGFFTADWPADGTDFFHTHLSEGELDLQTEGGRFHCRIHEGGVACEPDTDRDGIVDNEDVCPTVPAGPLDEAGDGCPDVVDDTDPLCKEKPTCSTQADCDQFLKACRPVADVMSDRDLYPPLGLDIHCDRQLDRCELFTRVVAPFEGCPLDQPPPPSDPPSFCGETCSTDEDCTQYVDCPTCPTNICFHGCCGSSDDSDNDGVPFVADNCSGVPNEDQADCDGDGIGDRCDTCPADFDPNNGDFDRDTVGDACETGSECGNGFCELEENVVTCGEDCDPKNGVIVCDPAFSSVSDCRGRFVELGQSPLSPFDNPLAPSFLYFFYNQTETLNCCESVGCEDPENCGPGSYCDSAGYCALIPCSSDSECGGTSCLPDGWCGLSCGNGVCDEGETTLNCFSDCVDRPPPPPVACSVPPDQCAFDGDCAVGEFCNGTCSCEVGPPPPPNPTPPPPH